VWLIGTIILGLLRVRNRASHRRIAKAGTVALATIVSLYAVWLLLERTPEQSALATAEILRARTIERSVFEDFDVGVARFLFQHPEHLVFGIGLGNAHLYANEFLTRTAREYADRTAFVAKIGLLKLLSELGVAGVLLFLLWVSSLRKGLTRYRDTLASGEVTADRGRAEVEVFVVVAATLFLARTDLLEHVFLSLGLASGLLFTRSGSPMMVWRSMLPRRSVSDPTPLPGRPR
jgi:hypothetical protein